jgi:hypothetical protein
MNSIFFALSEEVNHPELAEFLICSEYDFSKGAFKTGISNLKAIREMFVQEDVPEYLVEALDAFIKAINGKKFEDSKTARKTIETIMKIIYPVSEEDDDISSDDDDLGSSEEDDISSDDEDDEISSDDDNDEEMLDLEDAVERYNELLKNKVLNKYIVAKRFKITKDIDEDEEKREMIDALYKVVKNIYENFASEKDADKMLNVLEEIDEINDMI